MLVKDLAAFLDATLEGNSQLVLRGVAALEDATPQDLSFVSRGRAAKLAAESAAGCLLVPLDFENSTERTIIRTRDPRAAAARARSRS